MQKKATLPAKMSSSPQLRAGIATVRYKYAPFTECLHRPNFGRVSRLTNSVPLPGLACLHRPNFGRVSRQVPRCRACSNRVFIAPTSGGYRDTKGTSESDPVILSSSPQLRAGIATEHLATGSFRVTSSSPQLRAGIATLILMLYGEVTVFIAPTSGGYRDSTYFLTHQISDLRSGLRGKLWVWHSLLSMPVYKHTFRN
jgi:hypothetical protein